MRHLFSVFLVIATLATAGCVSVSVFGVVGDEGELYTGSATGYANKTGTIELKNDKGNRCTGDFVYTSHLRGHGFLACDDGQRAMIDFRGLSSLSGYGVGTSETGQKIVFTYGLSRAESARYLGFGVVGPSVPGAIGAAVPGATGAMPAARTLRKIGSGTGFFVSRAGHVLTSEHVVRACTDLRLVQPGGATIAATILGSDKANDLAVLKADIAPSVVAALRGRPARQGESVVAFGFPLNESLGSGGVLTTGNVSALSGLRDDSRYIQISAPIQPGGSGFAILDVSGNAIGIATSTYSGGNTGPQNVNFALKADIARTFLNAAGVTPDTTAAAGRDLGAPELAERARGFTVRVECYR